MVKFGSHKVNFESQNKDFQRPKIIETKFTKIGIKFSAGMSIRSDNQPLTRSSEERVDLYLICLLFLIKIYYIYISNKDILFGGHQR